MTKTRSLFRETRDGERCSKCGCEITYRERVEDNDPCWICARNQRDRDEARSAD